MLEHTKHAMRQSEPKQEQRHATTSRPDPQANPAGDTAQLARTAVKEPNSGADLACAPNRGTTPRPPAWEPENRASTPSPASFAGAAGEPAKIWLTLADVADELEVSTRTVMRWVERGQFPAVLLPGGRKRIHRDAFRDWLAALPRADGGG
jgi:excisionase family DNA binding protein